jgi:multisubunit Na+/H+ antiporter MnhG subunit
VTAMGLDIRLPIGLLFVLIGSLLTFFGAFGDPAVYVHSMGFNVDVWWGLVMLLAGVILLRLSRRSRR